MKLRRSWLSSRMCWSLNNPPMPSKPRRLRALPRIPKSRRAGVIRAEFDRVIDILNERGDILKAYRSALDEHHTTLEQMRRDLDIQFKRIAQLQSELDLIKRERP